MPAVKIKVNAYASFKGEERPGSFIIEGGEIRVSKILDMWIEEGVSDRKRKRFFKVKGNDKRIYNIYFDEEGAEWFYER
jgi:hypothetical protein